MLEKSLEICIFRSKSIKFALERKKIEIAELLKKNLIHVAKTKMFNFLKNENDIERYDILEHIIVIIKEKCSYIQNNGECPTEIIDNLDNILYASSIFKIDELKLFREKIIKKYGNEYINKRKKKLEELNNEDLFEKFQSKTFSDELKTIRLKQICQEKNIECDINKDSIPGEDLLSSELLNKNPYESTIQHKE